MSKCETIKEKSIIYYLFYFICRCFFYIIMHNNFLVSKPNTNIFLKFFKNFIQIISTSKLYLEKDAKNSSMIINKGNNTTMEKNIEEKINKGFYEAFDEIKKYPNEFNNAIICCHNFISFVLFSVDMHIKIDDQEEHNIIDQDMLKLLEIFVTSFSILHDINEYFSIIDYKKFFNDSLSKSLIIRRELRTYLHNERVKQRQIKEKQNDKKNKEKDKNNNNIIDDDEGDEDDTDKNKIKFTLFDYMWLFTPAAKNDIIFLFNDNQQKSEVRILLNQEFDRDSVRDSEFGFLNFILNRNKFNLILNIRRDNLIEDTLNEVSKPDINFQNKLKVKFKGEDGVDEEGVSKEFFILLISRFLILIMGCFLIIKKLDYIGLIITLLNQK